MLGWSVCHYLVVWPITNGVVDAAAFLALAEAFSAGSAPFLSRPKSSRALLDTHFLRLRSISLLSSSCAGMAEQRAVSRAINWDSTTLRSLVPATLVRWRSPCCWMGSGVGEIGQETSRFL